MSTPIVMPKLGLTMTEGLLASWSVKPGDAVQPGDILFVVETDKIATEVEAQSSGHVESIAIPEGTVVAVGAIVATLAGPDAALPPSPPRTLEPVVAEPGQARILATPLARRLARDATIDLATLKGSGPQGRIKACDVKAAAADRDRQGEPSVSPPKPDLASPAVVLLPGTRRSATAIEKLVAKKLTFAKQTIPHFYVHADADVTRLLQLRQELNAAEGYKRISLTHFVVAALGHALARMPEANVVWAEEEIIQLADVDIGVAVDTDRGVLVPVLRRVPAMALDVLAKDMGSMVENARGGRLQASDFEGGAMSVSNIGMFGAAYLTPIINPGQSAMLGAAAVRPVFRPGGAGEPVLKYELGLVLSCDHRVLNGVGAARLLDLVAHILQQPLSLLRA